MSKDIKGRSAKYKISTKISHKSIMLGFFLLLHNMFF